MTELGSTLKQARETMGLSQTSVADSLHVSRQAISRWENDRGYPDIDNLTELATLYNVTVDQLLGHKTDSTNIIPAQTDKLAQITHVSQHEAADNSLILIILAVIASLATPIGLILGPLVLKLNKKRNSLFKIVLFLAIIAILINVYDLFLILNNYFDWFSVSHVNGPN
ncbi:helix-turn-helix domain-containing protein [Periweissella cryptocerci]|nr:helix-turn-helix transcriptional regulator [Periweissella cryptocerci]